MKRDKFKSLGRTQLSSNPGRTINQRFSYTSLLWKNLPLIVQCRFRSAVYKTEHVGLIANILHWYEVTMASHSRNLRRLLRICMKNWMDRQFHREIVNYRAKVLSNIWFSLTSKSDKRFFSKWWLHPFVGKCWQFGTIFKQLTVSFILVCCLLDRVLNWKES